MIEVPVHNVEGKQTGAVQIDEDLLGGEVRPALLKQAYVRVHANNRLGAAKTKNRSETAYSTRKLYRQKGTGNARRGSAGTNLMRHGGMAKAKRPRSWRQDMPVKMRRLANRNALLAKIKDGELKVVETLEFDRPSTSRFSKMLAALEIDRTCLFALSHVRHQAALSARNLDDISVTPIDNLNAFDLLNHRFLLVEKEALEGYLARLSDQVHGKVPAVEEADVQVAATKASEAAAETAAVKEAE